MEIRREQVLKKLAEKFATFSNVVTIQNRAGYNDINKSAERLFIDVLNIAYNLQLRDMNAIQGNYPAIDLGDYNTRVCIQITSESTNQKFRATVKKFKENNLHQCFDRLIFLIISNKNLCQLSDNEIDTKVINLNDLYLNISKLADRDVYDIFNYLNENLISKIEPSDSILPSGLVSTYTPPKPNALISFLNFDNEPEYKKHLIDDVKSLSKIISELNKHQREFLYYIVHHGKFDSSISNSYGNQIILNAEQVDQQFNEYGWRICRVLEGKELIYVNEEYYPYEDDRYFTVLMPHFSKQLEYENLFCILKRFCDGSPSIDLKRIIVECDFSLLE